MTDPAELFERFVEARRRGEAPDAADYVAEAGDAGDVLAGMLAAHLAGDPDEPSDEAVLALAAEMSLEPARPWPELLRELRERRRMTRTTLVRRLAELLGVTGAEPQVRGYVHELESGQLAATSVRPAVVEALARALDAPRALLEASRWLDHRRETVQEAAAYAAPPMFAREADVTTADALSMLADEPPPDPRVDDLFTGGPDG